MAQRVVWDRMRSNLGLFGVLSALALAWVGLVTAIPVDVSTMDSIPLEHLVSLRWIRAGSHSQCNFIAPQAPMEVVPITDVDEYLTSLLEEGSMAKRPPPKPQAQEEEDEPEYKCMQGFKCPIQGSHCCKGGQYCCVYGCNNDDETLTCRPNVSASALNAAATHSVRCAEICQRFACRQTKRRRRSRRGR